jgi:deoxyribonuclease V
MKTPRGHGWRLSPKDAVRVQQKLAHKVITEDDFSEIRTVCGVDAGFKGTMAYAAAVVLSFPGLRIIETSHAVTKILMPYIPGLLSFREIPALIPALTKLTVKPDLLMADGQGLAHPRRLGLASHLGLVYDLPSIGCAKTRLCGQAPEPENKKGAYTLLFDGDETVGAKLRTRENTKPMFISIGHKISLQTAIRIVAACLAGYRLPQPTRLAHLETQKLRLQNGV